LFLFERQRKQERRIKAEEKLNNHFDKNKFILGNESRNFIFLTLSYFDVICESRTFIFYLLLFAIKLRCQELTHTYVSLNSETIGELITVKDM
jgi:hypothetical protein